MTVCKIFFINCRCFLRRSINFDIIKKKFIAINFNLFPCLFRRVQDVSTEKCYICCIFFIISSVGSILSSFKVFVKATLSLILKSSIVSSKSSKTVLIILHLSSHKRKIRLHHYSRYKRKILYNYLKVSFCDCNLRDIYCNHRRKLHSCLPFYL